MGRDRAERLCIVIPRRSSLALALILFNPWRAAEVVAIMAVTRLAVGAIGMLQDDMVYLRARKQSIEERANSIDQYLQQVALEMEALRTNADVGGQNSH